MEDLSRMRVDVGQHVIFCDEHGVDRDALVTAVWGERWFDGAGPTINLVAIDTNDGAQDSYGRQRDLRTSVVHQANTTAPGMYWRLR